jgi:hypothetical protein
MVLAWPYCMARSDGGVKSSISRSTVVAFEALRVIRDLA